MKPYATGVGLDQTHPSTSVGVFPIFTLMVPIGRLGHPLLSHAVFQEVYKCPRSLKSGVSMWGSKDETQQNVRAGTGERELLLLNFRTVPTCEAGIDLVVSICLAGSFLMRAWEPV